MLRFAEPQITDETIRETVRQVFSAPEYNRLALWQRFWRFVGDVLDRILSWILELILPLVPETSLARWLLGALLVLLAALAIWVVVLWIRRREARRRLEQARAAADAEATLRSAEDLAARGLFTEAAHVLYAALLAAAAHAGHLRLHHSKTVGDYVRELRGRAPAVFARFREFARSYELVIYGLGECDRERFEHLHALALPVVQHSGGTSD